MSFKDDFLEALKSVKRDILGNDQPEDSAVEDASVVDVQPEPFAAFVEPKTPDPESFPNEEVAADAFPEVEIFVKQDSASQEIEFESVTTFAQPFPPIVEPAYQSDAHQILDFESNDVYDDEKTIISKNTVLRGSLHTNDPIRMLGQVLGDIECRSNVVIAGKMQGNTVAANAQILNAQIDGDLVCDDSISINDSAWILGNIRAQQADINGKIKGNLEIRRGISIGSSSSIIGNISADELEIRRGAFVNGQIIMYSPSRDVIDRFDHFDSSHQ